MKALVLTQLIDNTPTALVVGENCNGLTLVARIDDYAVYMVAGDEKQIAMLSEAALVADYDWNKEIDDATAGALNSLLAAGKYAALPKGLTLGQGMLAMLGKFEPELYDVGDEAEAAHGD